MPTGVYKRTDKWYMIHRKAMEKRKGHIVSEETRKKIGDAQRGEKHYGWKGKNVKYRGLHTWITNNYGKADHCEMCDGSTAKVFDWANISGKYKRDREDWEMLCRRCHMKKDGRTEKAKKYLLLGIKKTPVDQLDISGNFIRSFNTVKEAAISVGVKYPGISKCLVKPNKTAGGYKWRISMKNLNKQ